ncbi:MAG: hypothetical protein ACTHLW_11040 [Verrucomicrobiota bacterium]
MRNRAEPILKIICLALAALLLTQTVRAILRSNPLAKATIPAVPSLSTNNTPSEAKESSRGTNSPLKGHTQLPHRANTDSRTNTDSAGALKNENTNAVANTAAATNPVVSPALKTNSATIPSPTAATDVVPSLTLAMLATNNAVATTNAPGTNSVGSNSMALQTVGTNSTALLPSKNAMTNTAVVSSSLKQPASSSRSMFAMMGMPGMGGGKPLPELPIATKARIDRISESELLGPVMRPMPLALLGIAGNSAFLRSATGQSGLVKEGDSLGELKLIRIGINRVLVDENGQKKELLIFNGYGSESLMPKQKETDETTPK